MYTQLKSIVAKFQVNSINHCVEVLKGAIGTNTTETWFKNYFEPLIGIKLNREQVLNIIQKYFKKLEIWRLSMI